MAFYYLLQALGIPPDSEIILPALTFWVVPEITRAAGLKPVFADVDPVTFNLDPDAFERAITPRTRAVVPTHLYGLPCDMEAILDIARRHRLVVIEDCAHALGATWQGRPVGTLGDAGFFSFQLLKPLNTYGGGMLVTNNAEVASRALALARSEPSPSDADVQQRLRLGRVQRIAIRPGVFTASLFPVLWASSSFRRRRTCTCGRRSDPSARFLRRTEDATATLKRPSGSKPSSTSMNGLRGPCRTPRPSPLRWTAVASPPPRCPAAGLTCSISTRSTRANAVRSYNTACDMASTSRACTSTSAHGCRSSATVTRQRQAQTAQPQPSNCLCMPRCPRKPFAGLQPSSARRSRRHDSRGRSCVCGNLSRRDHRGRGGLRGRVGAGGFRSARAMRPVLVAGALGAATGDQMYFYALRGRIGGWLTRFEPVAARQDAIVARVQRHRALMILALRFAPGAPHRHRRGVRLRAGAARCSSAH